MAQTLALDKKTSSTLVVVFLVVGIVVFKDEEGISRIHLMLNPNVNYAVELAV
ncbi:conserved hypothetical protein [Ricinus communis]|uniref:Uncharacterized protein n=1 Tax=Ricinus communis TaxID=3988 RepID=B9T598_RICCO|nr:conserved hypothetical protein [Ricinus communis]